MFSLSLVHVLLGNEKHFYAVALQQQQQQQQFTHLLAFVKKSIFMLNENCKIVYTTCWCCTSWIKLNVCRLEGANNKIVAWHNFFFLFCFWMLFRFLSPFFYDLTLPGEFMFKVLSQYSSFLCIGLFYYRIRIICLSLWDVFVHYMDIQCAEKMNSIHKSFHSFFFVAVLNPILFVSFLKLLWMKKLQLLVSSVRILMKQLNRLFDERRRYEMDDKKNSWTHLEDIAWYFICAEFS